MKRFLPIFILLCTVSFTTMAQIDKKVEVDKDHNTPRSVSAQAQVWFEDASSVLTVQLSYTFGEVTVSLADQSGVEVYRDNAPADGTKQRIPLPLLEPGIYTLTLECNGESWHGEITI